MGLVFWGLRDEDFFRSESFNMKMMRNKSDGAVEDGGGRRRVEDLRDRSRI